MNATVRKLRPGDYFPQYRPRGDTLRAKAARSQIETGRRPISLPKTLFLELSGPELWAALAEKRGRP
jgi:hypothetical protein